MRSALTTGGDDQQANRTRANSSDTLRSGSNLFKKSGRKSWTKYFSRSAQFIRNEKSNLLKPISELIRVCRKELIIRTPIYDMSYRIQLVYNKSWWQYTDVAPEEEFDENGNPRAFSYFDIHS